MVFGFWLKTVRTFLENFPKGSIKRHYVCPEQQFEESGLLKIFFSFYHFRTIIEETSHDLQKFEQGCHSCISYVQLNTLQAKCFFFWRKVTIFWFKNGRWARTKRFFGKKSSNVNKTVFYLSTGTFEGFLTNSFCRFWSLSRGVWEFCWNWFQQGRQNKVYFSTGIFDVERFFFELLSSFQSLSVWSKNFWTFVRRTPNALSKLRYMCSKRSFDENVFRTCFFFDRFRTVCENFLIIW